MEKENYLLNVKNLNIEFLDEKTQGQVVKNFNLTMKAGETVGLVGESGSGKTLSALTIAGLLQKRKDVSIQGEISCAGYSDLLSLKEKIPQRFLYLRRFSFGICQQMISKNFREYGKMQKMQ